MPYLPFDSVFEPALALKEPQNEYSYLQDLAKRIRTDIGVSTRGPIEFSQLIGLFEKAQTVLIPALWGKKRQPRKRSTHLPSEVEEHLGVPKS